MRVVAVVPAYRRADTVGATVAALAALAEIDAVVVVDDGSGDATSEAAAASGAQVVTLARNVGKGGAVAAGLAHVDADVVVLIDADTGATAAAARELIGPVVAGEADMTIAVLEAAGSRGGFGLVRDVAATAIASATGWTPRAPLSGQRAIRCSVLHGVEPAPRFGLEAGLTIDLHRRGARIVEVEAGFDHRHTGRSLAGFGHRMRQGRDLIRALVPRLGPAGTARAVAAALWRRVRR